ncbi:hypothetical protein ABPG74_010974 [Tetrahymena malaccensis]
MKQQNSKIRENSKKQKTTRNKIPIYDQSKLCNSKVITIIRVNYIAISQFQQAKYDKRIIDSVIEIKYCGFELFLQQNSMANQAMHGIKVEILSNYQAFINQFVFYLIDSISIINSNSKNYVKLFF